MKQRTLVLAIKKIVWAELALSVTFAIPAFSQSQPNAVTGNTATTTTATESTPASGSSAKVTQLQKFEVTGSLIRSSDKVGFNQVQTITAKDIQDSGATTVANFLRDTSANSASSWGEDDGGFAPGGAGIALRGMSEKYTLVLVDGQRVAPYGFAQNGTDTFFDLNTLPLDVVDRIEVVKTGAVSQYGSDAIAGVVNIITKKDFQGLQLDGSYGGATQAGGGEGTTKFSVLGGFGDLNADRFNVTAAASYYKANGITFADRDSTQTQNFTGIEPGGISVQPGSFWLPNGTPQALGTCPPGNHVAPATSNALTAGSPGTICSFDAANSSSIEPMTERLNAKVHAEFKINDNVQAFADLWESNNTTTLNTGVAQVVGGTGGNTYAYNPSTGSLNVLSNVVPASNPYNPFGVATPLVYSFPNAQAIETTSNFYRLASGVKGTLTTPGFGDWDWSAQYGHSESEVSNTYTNVLNTTALTNILQNGTYNFANPSATPNGAAGLFGDVYDQAISKLDTVDVTTSTANLFTLPTGDVGLGLGAQFQHQSEYIGEPGGYVSGQYAANPPTIQGVNGDRNVAAVYYQIDVPIIRNLTFSQSGRYDHYSDFGGAFSPRFALRYQPVSILTMYGSYNRGFRAPTLIENSQSKTISSQPAEDPYNPVNNGVIPITEVTNGNPDLQPERTKNYNAGFELSPTRTTDIGFDWYKIHVDNVIGSENIQQIIDTNNPTQVVRNADGTIAYVNTAYENLGYLNTDGFEFTFRQSLPTKIGTFTVSGDWAYVWHFTMPIDGVATNYAGNNGAIQEPFGAAFPRWKGNTDLSWAYHKWNATLSWQYTGPYTQVIVPAGTYPGSQGGVASYSQFNLYVSYTGFKHWTIYGGVNNLFNRAPPFDPLWQAQAAPGYDQSLYQYIGRFAQLGATYKF